jgi:hypothetical protein
VSKLPLAAAKAPPLVPAKRNRLVMVWCLAGMMGHAALICARAEPIETPGWAVAATITNGTYTGSGIYLTPGLVITAAHVTAGWTGNLQVRIAGHNLSAIPLKEGKFEDVDVTVFSVDQQKLSTSTQEIQGSLCRAPAWPGDPVIIVDREWISRSHIVSSVILPPAQRRKFSTLIADVATTGNSGAGVFDLNHECLLGIMSRKFTIAGADIAKYFVPADEIHEFIPAELREQVLMK